jgi:CTP:molybdopterin cytidylyltransferase MocA
VSDYLGGDSLQVEPYISVVVPVYNGGTRLCRCLDALRAADYPAREILVVDDGSTDGSAQRAHERGAEVLRLDSRSGPAAARNHGAHAARGDVLLFVDSDVAVRPDTLSRVAATFRERPRVAAVFGSYDDAPAEENFFSQYKNLLHHFVHQRSSARAGTFWAGCGAVRAEAFAAVGGFDARRFARPSVEDIELGYRLRGGGFEIVLDPGIQAKHLKRWTLASMLRADIFSRALPWARLMLARGRVDKDLNLRAADRASACLVGAAFTLAPLSCVSVRFAFGSVAALAGVFALNLPLLRFFARRRGAWFAARAFAMQCLYYFYSGAVFVLCWAAHALKRFGATGGARRPPSEAET